MRNLRLRKSNIDNAFTVARNQDLDDHFDSYLNRLLGDEDKSPEEIEQCEAVAFTNLYLALLEEVWSDAAVIDAGLRLGGRVSQPIPLLVKEIFDHSIGLSSVMERNPETPERILSYSSSVAFAAAVRVNGTINYGHNTITVVGDGRPSTPVVRGFPESAGRGGNLATKSGLHYNAVMPLDGDNLWMLQAVWMLPYNAPNLASIYGAYWETVLTSMINWWASFVKDKYDFDFVAEDVGELTGRRGAL